MQKELIQKINEICNLFKEDKNILACGYTGSVSKDYADEYSDLDIMCICRNKPDYKKIYKNLLRLNKKIEIFNNLSSPVNSK